MISEPKDQENWNIIKTEIKKITGLGCEQYSEPFVKRRILRRLNELNINTYKEYLQHLKKENAEKNIVLREFTIHVTAFFRDRSMWEIFMKKIIPAIVERKVRLNQKSINIWSAGCSCGEETVSIAICFKEILGANLQAFKINILGSDLDRDTILRAKIAIYNKKQINEFKEMPEIYLEKYFERIAPDFYKPKKEILEMITYSQEDLINGKKLKNQDIIFCRNTVIYFDTATKCNLYEQMYDGLNPEGYFILGKTEILQGVARDKFVLFDASERIHIKK